MRPFTPTRSSLRKGFIVNLVSLRAFTVATALTAIVAATPTAQSSQTLVQRLDSIAGAGVRENRSVGIVAAVVKGKDTLLLKAYGKADVEGDVPATVDTVFPIGSDTKQFTAAAILQLRDQGKLSLDDDITKWLPDFETRGNKVTLRHLLGHTSGIVDLIEMPELRAMQADAEPRRHSRRRLQDHQSVSVPVPDGDACRSTATPATGSSVSSSRRRAGCPTRTTSRRGSSSRWACRARCTATTRRTSRAAPTGTGMRNGIKPCRVTAIVHTGTYAAGAICSTAEDLITWLQALHGGKVLTPKSYAEMITPSTLNDGTPLGTRWDSSWARTVAVCRYIGHDGGGFGFSSQTRWYPDAQLAVVVLTNSEPDDTTAVAENLAAAVLPAPPPAARSRATRRCSSARTRVSGAGRDMVIEVTQTPQGIAFSFDGAAGESAALGRGLDVPPEQALLTFRRSANGGPATELRFDTGGDHFILKRQ